MNRRKNDRDNERVVRKKMFREKKNKEKMVAKPISLVVAVVKMLKESGINITDSFLRISIDVW